MLKSTTVRSALLPGSMDPVSYWTLKAFAALMVTISRRFSAGAHHRIKVTHARA